MNYYENPTCGHDLLKGNYEACFIPRDPLKLRIELRTLNEVFAARISREGHTRAFQIVDGQVDDEYKRDGHSLSNGEYLDGSGASCCELSAG